MMSASHDAASQDPNWVSDELLAQVLNEASSEVSAESSSSSTTDPKSYRETDGRTYHTFKAGKYFFPNDAAEQNRLDLQHEVWRHLLDGELALAPLEDPKYALDIATGTGLWAYEFARLHPNCQVIGTDLSLIQSDERKAPSNIRFVRADSEDPWDDLMLSLPSLPDNRKPLFDYVHMRATVTCFEDTRTVLRHAFAHMRPGGWIELHDVIFNFYGIDDSFRGTGLQKWVQLVRRGFQASGRDMDKTMYYVSWLLEAGFSDITEKRLLAPSNAWSTDPKYNFIGQLNHINMRKAITSFGSKTMPAAGVGEEESKELVKQALIDIDDVNIHAYTPIHVVYARKPLTSD